mgnify:CR=1 FL=1
MPLRWPQRLRLAKMALFIATATCDAIENLISFVILGDPLGFSPWLAIPYSSFAAIKFACIEPIYLALGASLLPSAVHSVRLKLA